MALDVIQVSMVMVLFAYCSTRTKSKETFKHQPILSPTSGTIKVPIEEEHNITRDR